MRLLHTSDWHLGRTLHGESMLDAQAAFLEHLAEVIRAENVELLVVSGDIYDRALPPVPAVTLLDEGLDQLLATGVQILLTAGNHDSAQRLGFGARRSARSGLHVRTGLHDATTPLLLSDEHGHLACYGIGYLEPAVLAAEFGCARSHQAVLGTALAQVRADLAERGTPRSLVAAHAFVSGAEPTDSERDIRVGGVDRVPVTLLEGFDYAALGHLHRPQTLTDAARYSGSPIAYSFSEAGQVKGSWLVQVGKPGTSPEAEFIPAPVQVPLARLRGTLADLLTDPAHRHAEQAYCQVVLTDTERPRAPMERLRRRFPRTLSMSFEPAGMPDPTAPVPVSPAAGSGLDDESLCCSFFAGVRGHSVSPEERRLIQQAVEAARLAEAAE
ncbi:MAG: exonuclease SbcCD subunit D [Actinomycetales bacterium]